MSDEPVDLLEWEQRALEAGSSPAAVFELRQAEERMIDAAEALMSIIDRTTMFTARCIERQPHGDDTDLGDNAAGAFLEWRRASLAATRLLVEQDIRNPDTGEMATSLLEPEPLTGFLSDLLVVLHVWEGQLDDSGSRGWERYRGALKASVARHLMTRGRGGHLTG